MKKAIVILTLLFTISMPQAAISLSEIEIAEKYDSYSKLNQLRAEKEIHAIALEFTNNMVNLFIVEQDLTATLKLCEETQKYFLGQIICNIRIVQQVCYYESKLLSKNLEVKDIKRLEGSKKTMNAQLKEISLACYLINNRAALNLINKARSTTGSSIAALEKAIGILRSVNERNIKFLESLREAEKNKKEDIKK